ncbi:uncharacterized protein Tco025E_03005 [Trypanosoma conorhini]|uniref:Uncharacterized protein n=1 Tax=Trypanosoma conorhini TaxID=83891 RepID=A0A3R7NTL9_9TRYP|nr:uncharacterized protein Tco025E_03005 [Trypanosoma conorhini]RNF23296.1 hypothetical protein Tco025E_03005 [Trypanosoma conorhini]
MSGGQPQSESSRVVWNVAQHLTARNGFPCLLQLEDAQVCVDYPATHHPCCWTCAMLRPLWESFAASAAGGGAGKKATSPLQSDPPRGSSSASSFGTCNSLTELSQSIYLLFKRQQQQRPPCGSVNRLRYIHLAPPVVRIGKGISGTLSFTFSLRRCEDVGETTSALFPSFLAVEVCDSIADFITITVLEARRRPSHGNMTLLLLQSIDKAGKVATYSTFDAELRIGCFQPSFLSSLPCELPLSFRVYAAFYSSVEAQLLLDEPFMHLWEWKPNMTQEERFAVVNPKMDPAVAFSVERRRRASMERHIRAAVAQMDGIGDAEGLKYSPSSLLGAKLRHIATVQTSRGIVMEPCTQPGNGTLAAVMPRDISWPLQLLVADAGGNTWRSPPIAGSSSLERLACELSYLEGRRSGADGNNAHLDPKNKAE